MTDVVDNSTRSRVMSGIRARNTRPGIWSSDDAEDKADAPLLPGLPVFDDE